MIKTAFILVITLVFVYVGLSFLSEYLNTPRSEIIGWTGILFAAFLIEHVLKYIIMLPFKRYFKDVQKHVLAKAVQRAGISLSYISVWVAIGFTPVNGLIKGEEPTQLISNPLFLKIALVLLLATILFSTLWWLSLKLKR